jgi:uncharacterized SAM-binding protein YcdF (DUF218 family)
MSRGLNPSGRSLIVRVVLLSGLAVSVAVGAVTLRIWDEGRRDEQRPVDAIVVLGAAEYDGRPSPVFAARLDHAVALYRAGLAPYFVVTGGKRPGDRTTEAAVARRFALDRDVPDAAIFGEDEASNTLDSLRSIAAEMRARGLRTALFVSDPTHMYRVLRIASDLGIEAYGSPTRTSPIQADLGRRVRATVHELGALALYVLTGGPAAVDPTGVRPVAGD